MLAATASATSVNDGCRVSCLPQAGGPLLRHFGAQDYVNNNP